jgi:MFS family permease
VGSFDLTVILSALADPGRRALMAALAGAFMSSLDVSIANVAAPAMEASLRLSGPQVHLVLSMNTVAFAATLVTGRALATTSGTGGCS